MIRPGSKGWSRAWRLAPALAFGTAGGCSSGAPGSLVDCVVPGATCCQGGECANGLACELGVCVAVEAGGAEDASLLADGSGEGTVTGSMEAGESGDATAVAPTDAPSASDSSTCPVGSVCTMNVQGYMACVASDGGAPVYTCGGAGPQGPPMTCPEGWVCGPVGQGGYCYIPC